MQHAGGHYSEADFLDREILVRFVGDTDVGGTDVGGSGSTLVEGNRFNGSGGSTGTIQSALSGKGRLTTVDTLV